MGMLQFLKISYALLGFLLLSLLLVDCVDSNLQGKDALEHKAPLVANPSGTKIAKEQNVGANSGSDPTIVAPLKKEKQVENPKQVTQNDVLKTNVSKPLDSKDKSEKISEDTSNVGGSKEGFDSKEVKNKDKASGNTGGSDGVISEQVMNKKESANKEGDNSKQVTNKGKESGKSGDSKEGFDSKQLPAKDRDKESSGWMEVKENSRDEECDPSNMCVDAKKNLTACLRVPGNDSPDLSLQIWNKGTKSVTISITAPAFVQLEETKVQLQPKEDKKVRVSIEYEGMDSLIFLTTEDSRCTLDFKELVPHDSRVETGYSFKLRYLNNWKKIHFIIFLSLTSVLVFGCAWMYFGLRKKLILGNGYREVEMELPVSDVPKTVTEASGGWDNSWDDNWDDEEAPMTPTLPATPNLSSRGLASRRLSKEAWKD